MVFLSFGITLFRFIGLLLSLPLTEWFVNINTLTPNCSPSRQLSHGPKRFGWLSGADSSLPPRHSVLHPLFLKNEWPRPPRLFGVDVPILLCSSGYPGGLHWFPLLDNNVLSSSDVANRSTFLIFPQCKPSARDLPAIVFLRLLSAHPTAFQYCGHDRPPTLELSEAFYSVPTLLLMSHRGYCVYSLHSFLTRLHPI